METIKTLAIYPSNFDPFLCTHQNVVEKAERIFGSENVIIAVGISPEKTSSRRKDEIEVIANEKMRSIKRQFPMRRVEYYTNFLTEYVREKESEGYRVVVIRGLRNSGDFEHEYATSRIFWDQMPLLNVVYIPIDPMYTHVSSKMYRSLEKVKSGSGHYLLAK